MQLHDLKRTTPNKKKKRVGRGGRRGKTSGRGHKGQKARAGGTPRPQARDMIKKIPKRRGHGKHRAKTVHNSRLEPEVVNLFAIEKHFADGETVSPETLAEKKLVRHSGKRIPPVKVLSQGALTKKVTFSEVTFSEAAREKAKKAGATLS